VEPVNFGIPDFEPVITAVEMLFYGGAFALTFAAGYITGGICQR
jgi:hypothetical protein